MGFHPTGSDRNAAGKLVQDPSERLRRVYWRFGWSCAAVQTLLGGNRVIVILPTYNMSSWSPACWRDRTVRPKRKKKKHLIKKEKKRKEKRSRQREQWKRCRSGRSHLQRENYIFWLLTFADFRRELIRRTATLFSEQQFTHLLFFPISCFSLSSASARYCVPPSSSLLNTSSHTHKHTPSIVLSSMWPFHKSNDYICLTV